MEKKVNSGEDVSIIYAWILSVASIEIGVKEVKGLQDNPRIVEYHKVTLDGCLDDGFCDEIPWCASFVCWVLESVGIESTKSAAAFTFLNWGQKAEKPTPGAVCVFKFAKGYHVGFWLKEEMNHIWVLGGNQNDEVNVRVFKKSALLDCRIPSIL